MKIIILSRNPSLYSTESLYKAAYRRNHQISVIDHMHCDVYIETGNPHIMYLGKKIENADAIIPRIGYTATFHGAAIIRQFESMGVFTTLGSQPLLNARDKLSCLQILSANGLSVPKTIVSDNYDSIASVVDQIEQYPVIIKLLNGTHGLGVILAENRSNAESILEAFYSARQKVMIQEYIGESQGSDLRAFIVDGKIAGAMKRHAAPGEFRSNLHRGATAVPYRLTDIEMKVAIRAVKILGLKIAGVDLLQSRRGPLILEVNASPGLEGIESVTGKDIAGRIIQFIEDKKRR